MTCDPDNGTGSMASCAKPTRLVVVGAGIMGLAAAHRALSLGHDVDIVEADDRAGGMAAHFDFAGLSIERFYHFVCKSDTPTFALMAELGISDKMRWRATRMAYYIKGQLHEWGNPIALLKFPHLSWLEKIRTGLQMFLTTRADNFDPIENLTSRVWVERGSGKGVYQKLWRRLQEMKFHEYADNVSASWIATRIRRIGRSRRSIFQEELGFIEGGSETLVEELSRAIVKQGGRIHLGQPVERILTSDGAVTGVRVGGRFFPADAVISTVPVPLINKLVPDLPQEMRDRYGAIVNIGVVCVILKLARQVSPYFWLNIVDADIELPGIIEFSNLRAVGVTIVYAPYYMPVTHYKWNWEGSQFIAEAFACLKRINPEIVDADLLGAKIGRLRYAQPVCGPDFRTKLPSVVTPVRGLQVADTCYYYPEDRGIAESIRFGRKMAEAV